MYGPGAYNNNTRVPVTSYFVAHAHTDRPVYACICVFSDSREVDGVAEQNQGVLVCGGVCMCVYVYLATQGKWTGSPSKTKEC